MKKILALMLCASCADSAQTPANPSYFVIPTMSPVLHVDVGFSAEERREIHTAALAWQVFAGVYTTCVDDFDFENLPSLRVRYYIQRVPVTNTYTQELLTTRPGIIAYTRRTADRWGTRGVYVIDGKVSRDGFMWVVAHELGHLYGLDDLPTQGDVMSGSGYFPGTWFTSEDLSECRRVGLCSPGR